MTELNGRNGVQWKAVAVSLALLVTSAFGWLFWTVIGLSNTSVDKQVIMALQVEAAANARSVQDLWKWVQALQEADTKWKDRTVSSDAIFQAEMRAAVSQTQADSRTSMSTITATLTELRIHVEDILHSKEKH